MTPTVEPEEAVHGPHPVRVALGEVLVDGDDVHAFAGERVEVGRERRDERLALAGAHFGDLALVQRDAADELHVEVAHAERAARRLAHHGERLGQQFVQRGPFLDACAQLIGLGAQLLVAQGLDGRLEGIRLARPSDHNP